MPSGIFAYTYAYSCGYLESNIGGCGNCYFEQLHFLVILIKANHLSIMWKSEASFLCKNWEYLKWLSFRGRKKEQNMNLSEMYLLTQKKWGVFRKGKHVSFEMLDYDFLYCKVAEGGWCILFCLGGVLPFLYLQQWNWKLSQFTMENLMNSNCMNMPFPTKTSVCLFCWWCQEAIFILETIKAM